MSSKFCIHCNKAITRASSTRDHVPSKCLLNEPYPENLDTVRICGDCNKSFSPSEEYVAALLGTLLWNDDKPLSKLGKILESNWKLQDRLDAALSVESTGTGARVALEPDAEAFDLVVRKNAVGHLWLANAMVLSPEKVVTCALENLPYEARDQLFGQTDRWSIVQQEAYRFTFLKSLLNLEGN